MKLHDVPKPVGPLCARPQVEVLHDAAVFICVHGADCTNMVFMPAHGAVIEISPTYPDPHTNYTANAVVRKPTYFDLARQSGKMYTELIEHTPSSIAISPDNNPVSMVGTLNVSVVPLRAAVSAALNNLCYVCGDVCPHLHAATSTGEARRRSYRSSSRRRRLGQ